MRAAGFQYQCTGSYVCMLSSWNRMSAAEGLGTLLLTHSLVLHRRCMHSMSHLFLSLVNNLIDRHREKLKGLMQCNHLHTNAPPTPLPSLSSTPTSFTCFSALYTSVFSTHQLFSIYQAVRYWPGHWSKKQQPGNHKSRLKEHNLVHFVDSLIYYFLPGGIL